MGLVTSNICLLRWWLLVLTVVSTATSSASEYGASDYAHYQGSCKHAYQYHNERGKKHSTSLPAAYPPASYPSELSPVDWYATKVGRLLLAGQCGPEMLWCCQCCPAVTFVAPSHNRTSVPVESGLVVSLVQSLVGPTPQTSLRKIVQALPEGYPALGWVVHTNGKCSFRGSQMPRCPEEADKHGSCTHMLLPV